MRKNVPRGLVTVGLAIAVFAFPSAAWADPGDDKKKEHPATLTEDAESEAQPEPEPEPPVEEPEMVEEPGVVEQPAEELVDIESAKADEELVEADKKDEDELEEEQSEIPINPGNVGTTAADFETQGCDHIPGGTAPEGLDGWVFVLPGNDAAFVSVSASFAEDGTIAGQLVEGHDGKFAYVTATAGWTLTGATAVINGTTPQSTFNLTHACPGTSVPPPPCDDGSQPPCEEEPPPCEDGSQPPCEEDPPACEDGSDPPCEEEPPPGEEPRDEDDSPPVSMHPPTEPGLEDFAAKSGQDGLAITGNSLGLLMLIGASLLTAGGLALVLYRVALRARRLGGDVGG